MDENAYASQAIFESPPENWRRPPCWPHTTWMKNIYDDLSSLDLGICEASRDPGPDRLLKKMTELTKILGKSYDNADFQNFFRKS